MNCAWTWRVLGIARCGKDVQEMENGMYAELLGYVCRVLGSGHLGLLLRLSVSKL